MTNRANKIILDLYLLDLTTLVRRVPQVSNSISTFYHFNLLKYDWFCRRNDSFSFSFSFIKNQRYGFGLLNNRQTFQSNALFFIFCHNYHSQSTIKKSTLKKSTYLKLAMIKNLIKNNYNPFKDKFFISYLAGFFEGNGYLFVSKTKTRNRAYFRLTSHLKNKPFFEHLKKILGHGNVYKQGANGCDFQIESMEGVLKMSFWLNGELRTPKISQLDKLIDFQNERYNCNFIKHDVKKTPIADDAWLAGFADADGSFQIKCPKNEQSINKSITCSFEIKQKKKDPKTQESFEPVLTEVSNFLGCRLTGQKADYYRIHPSNKKSLAIMLKYFSKYNLYTSRRLDQQDWAKAAKLILEKKHLEKENIKYIRSLKNSMNDKRTYFNWKHLDEL